MKRNEIINSANSVVNEVVQIVGTNFDRRRKVTNSDIRRINQMVEAGKSLSTVAEHFGVSAYTVRLHTDSKFRKKEYARRANYPQYTEYNSSTNAERAEYKRELLAAGKKLTIKA